MNSRRPGRKLSPEDRILWARVTRSVTPLAGKAAGEGDDGDPDEFAVLFRTTGAAAAPASPQSQPPAAMPARPAGTASPAPAIDRTTRARLARGRLPIEGKVDLHGLTQGEAHALLLSFLRRAHADGRRHVLVVTGKGTSLGSDGVLRRAVPGWLATAPFRMLVSAHEPAAARHGGSGALYVRLRRRPVP